MTDCRDTRTVPLANRRPVATRRTAAAFGSATPAVSDAGGVGAMPGALAPADPVAAAPIRRFVNAHVSSAVPEWLTVTRPFGTSMVKTFGDRLLLTHWMSATRQPAAGVDWMT